MLALICEKCGGKLTLQNNKIAYCENCGTEFSIMHSKDGISNLNIDNYLMIAREAFDAGNNEVAEKYCNKIIENDPYISEVLLLKGKAVGWQSTLNFFRFKEAAICFSKAYNSASSEEESKEIHEQVEKEYTDLATSLIRLRCDRFMKWPDVDESMGFKGDLNEIKEAIFIYYQETRHKVNGNQVFSNVSTMVKNCMAYVSKTILLEYRLSRTREAYYEFRDKIENCVDIMKRTIDLCDDDNKSDIVLYKLSIDMLEMLIEQNTTDQIRDRWGAYTNTPRLSLVEQTKVNNIINEYRYKISRLK